ncbi:copper chaperone PCu(A)C [Pelagerythrobacter marensis]|uniref:Copper chaperone PCu(A)C n=1 Tax=Pelagerythrobacter marensis TaxID=543877 RepID=A0ABZ2D719_9SPHN
MKKYVRRLRGRQGATDFAPHRIRRTIAVSLSVAMALAACDGAPGDAPTTETRTAATGIAVEQAWSRETAPGQDVGGAFLTIRNTGDEADRLVGGTTPIAGDVQIHTVDMEGGVMRMRELAEGLEIAAKRTVTLAPGGYHIMLMDLREPLARGAHVPLTLEFEKAGAVAVTLDVQPIGAEGPGEAHHD